MSKIPEIDFDNMACYELMGMKTSDDRCEEVVRAIRDTKLSIARELYDEAKVRLRICGQPDRGLDYDVILDQAELFDFYANKYALEALGWEGL